MGRVTNSSGHKKGNLALEKSRIKILLVAKKYPQNMNYAIRDGITLD